MIVELDYLEGAIAETVLIRDYASRIAVRSLFLAEPVLTEEDRRGRSIVVDSICGEASVINKLVAARKGTS